ncbi:NTP transferase domain-containing protein [bacterium]|nr:NTP transferase domain-containing protein [bacterium]
MKTVILAGGKGTRLRPYTTIIPKPLLPVGGMPILDVVLKQLASYAISEVHLAVGYLGELIKTYFGKERYGMPLYYHFECDPLGTAGPLANIEGLDDTFVVMNGDVLSTLDLDEFVEFHKSKKAVASIATYNRDVYIDFGILKIDENRYLTDYIEKPTLKYSVSMGVYLFEADVLAYIEKGKYLDFPDLIRILISKGERVASFPFDGYWLDIGRHEDYEKAIEEFDSIKDELFKGRG